LGGTTGRTFFTGINASDIAFNQNLADDPPAFRPAAWPEPWATTPWCCSLPSWPIQSTPPRNQTFLENYGQTVSRLGGYLNGLSTQLTNQDIVEQMLLRQRDSVSGVSWTRR
jgi:flagellar hook-associated protein FlgK